MKKLSITGVVFILSFLTNCNFSGKPDIEYIPLKQFKGEKEKLTIANGTELQLIGYSGGKKSDDENIYYSQFVAIDLSANDTVCILSPLIGIDEYEKADNKIYVSPTHVDFSKEITRPYFQQMDSNTNFILQMNKFVQKNVVDTSVSFYTLRDKIILKQWVVVNNVLPLFKNNSYKTTVGIINFQKISGQDFKEMISLPTP